MQDPITASRSSHMVTCHDPAPLSSKRACHLQLVCNGQACAQHVALIQNDAQPVDLYSGKVAAQKFGISCVGRPLHSGCPSKGLIFDGLTTAGKVEFICQQDCRHRAVVHNSGASSHTEAKRGHQCHMTHTDSLEMLQMSWRALHNRACTNRVVHCRTALSPARAERSSWSAPNQRSAWRSL